MDFELEAAVAEVVGDGAAVAGDDDVDGPDGGLAAVALGCVAAAGAEGDGVEGLHVV